MKRSLRSCSTSSSATAWRVCAAICTPARPAECRSAERGLSARAVTIQSVSPSRHIEQGEQIDLGTWAQELQEERERVAEVNERRAARRGFLVFATDPERAPDEPGYREVY